VEHYSKGSRGGAPLEAFKLRRGWFTLAALGVMVITMAVFVEMTGALSDDLTTLPVDELAERLEIFNEAYRRGAPLISDAQYDALVEHLRSLAPDHPFLKAVEPEVFAAKRQVRHPAPMLSTEKAYSVEELKQFVARIHKKAAELGIHGVQFKATPKLDGLAGRDDGQVLATRGDGFSGYDITSALEKGVKPLGGRGKGLGEIVIAKSYFQDHLADSFEHPRNLVVGIVASENVNAAARQALDDGAVQFVPYAELAAWTGEGEALVGQIEEIYADLIRIDYPVDGLVIEVTDPALRQAMGATTHHHRWQIAYKRRGETAVTTVEAVTWQVGRTGNLTPVMAVAPVSLSGATIRRVTAHNAERVLKDGIGPGARIEIIRSGEVIPKIVEVLQSSDRVELPQICPSCQTALEREGPFLRCPNTAGCRDQIVQRIHHWFHTIGNADWFGVKTVERLVDAGFDSLAKIYDLNAGDFEAIGFGPVQSANLVEAVALSRSNPTEDWRFLAAFGLPHLGVGDSRKLLRVVPLELLMSADAGQIRRIHGFGALTSQAIAEEMAVLAPTIADMLRRGFNLERTPPVAADFVVSSGALEVVEKRSKLAEKEKRERLLNIAARLVAARPLDLLGAMSPGEIGRLDFGIPLTVAEQQAIAAELACCANLFATAASLGLDWVYPESTPPSIPSFFSGKRVVFTGKMAGGSREEMQAEARRLGAVVQTAVGAATDYLICGEKVGDVKLAKARELGVTVIDEAGYRDLLHRNGKGGP
jgi:DNA ligase (NAD+)